MIGIKFIQATLFGVLQFFNHDAFEVFVFHNFSINPIKFNRGRAGDWIDSPIAGVSFIVVDELEHVSLDVYIVVRLRLLP